MTASQKKLIFKIFKAVAVPNIVTNKVICASSMIFYLYAFVPTHLRSQFMHRCVAPVSVRTLLCKEYCTGKNIICGQNWLFEQPSFKLH